MASASMMKLWTAEVGSGGELRSGRMEGTSEGSTINEEERSTLRGSGR